MDCPKCGSMNKDASKFCIECGGPLQKRSQPIKKSKGKSPGLALVLSLLIVGLGQFYNGQHTKAFVMLFIGVVTGLLSASIGWWIVAIWSAIDAYKVAQS